MGVDSTSVSFMPFIPEIIVLVMIGVIMVVDLFIKEANRKVVYVLSQLTLLVAAAFTWHDLGARETLFDQQFVFDDLAFMLKLFMYILTFGVFLYSRGYVMRKKIMFGEFHVLMLLSLLGGMVLVSANSLLTLYIGLELLSLPQYAMVAMLRDETKAPEAAMKYFVMGAVASGILLYGISLIYGATGSFLLPNITTAIGYSLAHSPLLLVGMIFIVVAIAFKFGAVPFHMWVPDVFEGSPTAVTTFIATVPKLAGFAMMVRLLYETLPLLQSQWSALLMALAILSLVVGNLLAIVQTNIKRMFGYSAVAHVGFIFLGMSLGTTEGYTAALFYTITYALMSLGGFGVIALLERSGQAFDHIEALRGLNSRNPWLAFIMMLLLLSMAGVPPLLGFDAKLLILFGLVHQGYYYVTGIALLMAVIAAYYYLRVIKTMYFDAPSVNETVPLSLDGRVGISVNGLAVLVLGCLPAGLIALCQAVFA